MFSIVAIETIGTIITISNIFSYVCLEFQVYSETH